ncbi:MAG: TIGR02757 family protein [Leptospirales bacterium]|nr:TIGR02757 family protein [Leptospirales bacterium]
MKHDPDIAKRQRIALVDLHTKYARAIFLESDPIGIVSRFQAREDIEVVGFLSAMFAYGNVKAIRGFLLSLLSELGREPAGRLIRGKINSQGYYRFQTAADIKALLNAIGKMMRTKGSLEPYFGHTGMPMRERIAAFQESLTHLVAQPLTRGLRHLIGDPRAKSAQKRYCMFLRWMVRDQFPDFGLYQTFAASDLVVPLDLHVARMARNLGWSKKTSSSWANAETITASLRAIHPDDPLRVDFPLTRPGILGLCKSRFLPGCTTCEVRSCCRIYARHA